MRAATGLTNVKRSSTIFPVTLSDLSQRLATKLGIPPKEASNKVAHWTKLGLIATTGDPHGGSGRHREYDEHALRLAALFLELSLFNLQVGDLRHILTLFNRELWRSMLERAAEKKAGFFYFHPHGRYVCGLQDEWRKVVIPGKKFSMIVVDLNRLVDGL